MACNPFTPAVTVAVPAICDVLTGGADGAGCARMNPTALTMPALRAVAVTRSSLPTQGMLNNPLPVVVEEAGVVDPEFHAATAVQTEPSLLSWNVIVPVHVPES
jgi:hypothetical protein